jgi:hypothetical protein
MKGVNPAWANLAQRHCDDCGKLYRPKQPLRQPKKMKDGSVKTFRGFCSDNCRKSYHKHGGAYRKLRLEVERLVLREVTRRVQLEEPCELCKGKGVLYTSGNGGRANGPKSPGTTCPKCINGAVLTSFGYDVLDLLRRHSDHMKTWNPALPLPEGSKPSPPSNRSPQA